MQVEEDGSGPKRINPVVTATSSTYSFLFQKHPTGIGYVGGMGESVADQLTKKPPKDADELPVEYHISLFTGMYMRLPMALAEVQPVSATVSAYSLTFFLRTPYKPTHKQCLFSTKKASVNVMNSGAISVCVNNGSDELLDNSQQSAEWSVPRCTRGHTLTLTEGHQVRAKVVLLARI
jgi:hypothetical protein